MANYRLNHIDIRTSDLTKTPDAGPRDVCRRHGGGAYFTLRGRQPRSDHFAFRGEGLGDPLATPNRV